VSARQRPSPKLKATSGEVHMAYLNVTSRTMVAEQDKTCAHNWGRVGFFRLSQFSRLGSDGLVDRSARAGPGLTLFRFGQRRGQRKQQKRRRPRSRLVHFIITSKYPVEFTVIWLPFDRPREGRLSACRNILRGELFSFVLAAFCRTGDRAAARGLQIAGRQPRCVSVRSKLGS
jgi:hypothetical protein